MKSVKYQIKDFSELKKLSFDIIQKFPKSKYKQSYLTLKNWRKLFFKIFIDKYWLLGNKCKYSDVDIARRVRLIEFFDYFVKDYDIKFDKLSERGKKMYLIKSKFYKMVIIDVWKNISKFELLSFYHYK